MSDERNRRKRKQKKGIPGLIPALVILLCTVLLIVCLEKFWFGKPDQPETTDPTEITTEPVTEPTTEPTEPPVEKIATAKISSMGDLLMHLPIINSYNTGAGYDFNGIFKYIKPYVESADYAVANLETTLYGARNGRNYSGYPQFNCPDEIVDAAKNAGFDMLLNANNHSSDTGSEGIARTIQVLDEKGMDRNGIAKDETEKRYVLKDLNGIRVGIICYTYETNNDPSGVALNGCPLYAPYDTLANTFAYGELDTFYHNIGEQLDAMRNEGAEATVVYIHWGNEYQLTPNEYQTAIAQKLCDMNVDVIIGGHPHVVEPVSLLTSSDQSHKTVCLYSMGNAVSNQRRAGMNMKTGHTEDGVLFSVTFAKYSDGTVLLESVEALPTWVNRFAVASTGKYAYEIMALDEAQRGSWRALMDLSDASEAECGASFDRTTALLREGVDTCNAWLNSVVKPDAPDAQKAA